MSWFHGIFMSLVGMLIQIERRDDDAVVISGSFQMIISSFVFLTLTSNLCVDNRERQGRDGC